MRDLEQPLVDLARQAAERGLQRRRVQRGAVGVQQRVLAPLAPDDVQDRAVQLQPRADPQVRAGPPVGVARPLRDAEQQRADRAARRRLPRLVGAVDDVQRPRGAEGERAAVEVAPALEVQPGDPDHVSPPSSSSAGSSRSTSSSNARTVASAEGSQSSVPAAARPAAPARRPAPPHPPREGLRQRRQGVVGVRARPRGGGDRGRAHLDLLDPGALAVAPPTRAGPTRSAARRAAAPRARATRRRPARARPAAVPRPRDRRRPGARRGRRHLVDVHQRRRVHVDDRPADHVEHALLQHRAPVGAERHDRRALGPGLPHRPPLQAAREQHRRVGPSSARSWTCPSPQKS